MNRISLTTLLFVLTCLASLLATKTGNNNGHHQYYRFDGRFKVFRSIIHDINDPFLFMAANGSQSNRGISTECLKQQDFYRQALDRLDLWALKIYDSSAKIPTGILNGNINQLGDFDQCLSVDDRNGAGNEAKIAAQYCLISFQVAKPLNRSDRALADLHRLAHSLYSFNSRINDASLIVPRFSAFNWALCLPSACTIDDLRTVIHTRIRPRFRSIGVAAEFRLDKNSCRTQQQLSWSQTLTPTSLIVMMLFLGLLVLTVLATWYEYRTEPQNQSQLYLCFSLIKNTRTLFALERSTDDIRVMHGIRFFAAAMLYTSHKSLMIFYTGFTNRSEMAEVAGKSISVLTRCCSLYTDIFLMLSGTLMAYSSFARLKRQQSLNFKLDLIARLVRLVPTLGACVLFVTYVLPAIGSGPQWHELVETQSELCKRTWWRTLLFISNYFGFDNVCLTHTHHVGIDTQFFLLAPLLVYAIGRWRNRAIVAVILLAIYSTYLRLKATLDHQLSNYIHFGISIERLTKTADYMYILPPHRLTSYLIGLLLGYYLRNDRSSTSRRLKSPFVSYVAFVAFVIAIFGSTHMSFTNYVYSAADAAWFAAIAPILLCLALFQFIASSHSNAADNASLLVRFLSARLFLVTTRLAYAAYLVQFPMFFYLIGSARHIDYFSVIRKNIEIAEICLLLVLSALLTLLFDYPFQNLRKYLVPPTVSQPQLTRNHETKLE